MKTQRQPRDELERCTQEYLSSLGIGEVVYEPNGDRTFPDFSVDGRIAVEVTRLVKPPSSNGRRSPDSDVITFLDSVKKALEKASREEYSKSYFVDLCIRKIPDNSEPSATTRVLRKFLSDFLAQDQDEFYDYKLNDCVKVDVYRASKKWQTQFLLRMVSGRFFSGWLVSDLLSECEHAICRKEEKLEQLLPCFEEVWLAVGSHLTAGLSDDSFSYFAQTFRAETRFTSLVLVNGANPVRSRRIPLS